MSSMGLTRLNCCGKTAVVMTNSSPAAIKASVFNVMSGLALTDVTKGSLFMTTKYETATS